MISGFFSDLNVSEIIRFLQLDSLAGIPRKEYETSTLRFFFRAEILFPSGLFSIATALYSKPNANFLRLSSPNFLFNESKLMQKHH